MIDRIPAVLRRVWIRPVLAALLLSSAPALAQTVSRSPYLQLSTPGSIVVRWRTAAPTNSQVRFGTNLNNLEFGTNSVAITNDHHLCLTGLSPETKYFYSIGTLSNTLAGGDTNHFFITSPLPGSVRPVRIWVIGDAGNASAEQVAVRDAYYAFTGTRHTDLWLMLGDNAYELGSDSDYQSGVFNIYGAMLRKSVVWPTLGNHDTAFSPAFTNSYPYFSIFTLPKNGEAGGVASGTEHYYSFDYANLHLICLDSMTANRATNGAMADWLRTDLNSTTNRWIIAYWHHPPYSKGSHDSDSEGNLVEMRQNFLPILEQGGVDLVLAGHSHSYERSFLLDGHYGSSSSLTNRMLLNTNSGREDETGPYIKSQRFVSHQGAVYAVVGNSGSVVNGSLNHPAMYISLAELGSLVLDINGNRLDAKLIRETGAVDDYFTLLKEEVRFTREWRLTNGQFEAIAANAAAGKTNILQTSSNFVDWTALSTHVPSSNSFKFIDPYPATNRLRVYRIQRIP